MASSAAEVTRHPGVGRTVTTITVRQLAIVWLLVTAAGLVSVGARATYGAQVTADEPQYLLTALSLAEDADLDIADELRDERFRDFHEVDLNGQTVDLNDRGQRLSPHDPLLPLMLAPAMAVGGWVGAKVLLAALAGTTAAVTAWVANRRYGVGAGTAEVVVTGFFVSPPLTAYATQVYPELPAALLVMLGLAGLPAMRFAPGPELGPPTVPTPASTPALVMAAVIGLPWLSVKYVPVAGVLALALLVTQLGAGSPLARRRVFGSVMVFGLAGALYLLLHQRIYGGWTVYSTGDHFVGGEFQVVGSSPDYLGRSRRLIGLLVDRRFGLIPWAPAFLLLVPAVAAAVRGPRRARWPLTLLATGWAVATWVALTMHGWWWPGRQLVVVLPVAVVLVARLVDGRAALVRTVAIASLISATNWWWLVAEASTGRRTLIVDFFETSAPLYRVSARLFPDHTQPGAVDWALTAAWSAAAIVCAVTVFRRTGRGDLAPIRPTSTT